MAGHLGPTDLAGVAIGIAVSISIFVGLVGIMQGLSPIAAHHLGAGKHEKSVLNFIRHFGLPFSYLSSAF